MYDIAEKYWQNMTSDGYPTDVEVVPCGEEILLFGEFLKSPLRNFHEFSDIINCKKFSDESQPTREEKALGKCEMCPSFGLKSQSEKDRHMRMFCRRQKTPNIIDGKYTCSFESCKRVFNS